MTLESDRLILAVPGARAAERLAEYNLENRAHFAPWDPPWTERQFDVRLLAQDLERDAQSAQAGTGYRFLIFEKNAGEGAPVVGRINFTNIVRGAFQACYMGYSLSHAAQGRGYMTEAARTAISYMFETVKLHRIMANYMPENSRSAAVLKRLGFVIEGTAKNYLYIAGAWRDHVLTSLTNPSEHAPIL